MLDRDDTYRAGFCKRQGEPSSGGERTAPSAKSSYPTYALDQWHKFWEPSEDLGLVMRLHEIVVENGDSLSTRDKLKAEYYKYSIALGLLGMDFLGDPNLTDEQRNEQKIYYDEGALSAAFDYLLDDPGNVIAREVMKCGTSASPLVQRAFLGLIAPAVQRFVLRYTPDRDEGAPFDR